MEPFNYSRTRSPLLLNRQRQGFPDMEENGMAKKKVVGSTITVVILVVVVLILLRFVKCS